MVGAFIYIHALSMRAPKTLTSLRICTDSHEPSCARRCGMYRNHMHCANWATLREKRSSVVCEQQTSLRVRLLNSIISRLATSEISNFKLASVAKQVGSRLIFTGPPKTDLKFSRDEAQLNSSCSCAMLKIKN